VMEIEPGTFVVANSGHIITRIIDKKLTNELNFLIVDGGMELLTRPLLYGSEHPIAIVRQDGTLLSSEYDQIPTAGLKPFGIVGRCCESGDSVRLDNDGNIVPVLIAEPEIGDYVVIGGTGALLRKHVAGKLQLPSQTGGGHEDQKRPTGADQEETGA